jgi:signal transduction histidine kinase
MYDGSNSGTQPAKAESLSPVLHKDGPLAAMPLIALDAGFHRQMASRLHNDLAQSLAMALIHLDDAWSNQEPEAFRRGHRLVRQAMQSTRALISHLVQLEHPNDKPTADLAQRLQNSVQGMQHDHGTCLEFVCDGHPGTVPRVISDILINSTQELLINALKHADTGRIDVRLVARPGHLSITVRDQGLGLAAAAPTHSGGLGLPLMRSRLASIGATLRWRSSRHGVQARIRLAMEAECAPE